ncbi:mycothiol conjugate amidase Mca [Corynebacterium diphtheriae]
MSSLSSPARLLAIHAHPDDESSKGAATMAKYVAEGHEVMVVTCTGGELGDVLNPSLDKAAVEGRIAEVRREEMAQAVKELGVQHRWLGYHDSGFPEGEPHPPVPPGSFALEDSDEVAAKIVEIIREFRPYVIVTYDENGGYPHPDHLKVHEVSMLAWDLAGDPDYRLDLGQPWAPLKLYYTHGFIRQRMEMFHNLLVEQGKPSPYEGILDRWLEHRADIMARVTTQVYAADYFDRRDAALKAHATQIDPAGTFFATPIETQQQLWPTEEFELARTRVSTSLPEDDLFEGIDISAD